MKKTSLIFVGLAVVIGIVTLAALRLLSPVAATAQPVVSAAVASGADVPIATRATVYKDPTCGCCEGYIAYLREQGFTVDVVNGTTSKVKEKYQIPEALWSCHTTVIGAYFVEGHVPIVAVRKLLEERPAIDGIALPGMPLGTPGMPGTKQEPWTITAVKDGTESEFIVI